MPVSNTDRPVPPAQPVVAIVEFLRRHVPFNEMPDAVLQFFAEQAKPRHYAKAAVITAPDRGVARTLYVIQRGVVHGRLAGARRDDRLEFEPGEAFPISAVLGARPTTLSYEAVEETSCYELDAASVEEVLRRSPEFRRFCTRHMDSLLQQANARLRDVYGRETLAQHSMMRPVGAAVRRAPVTCDPYLPLKEALARMLEHKIGAIVVVSPAGEPIGIFTERDLVRFTASGSIDLAQPVARYMTPDPVSLPRHATASEAALLMARRNIRHLLVVDGEHLVGVVSERALFALQRLSMREVIATIELAGDLSALQAAADDIRGLAKSMLAQGVAAESLTQLISALNDKLSMRILDIEAKRYEVDDVAMCWLALGSEGRMEQTLSSDQDNAILFDDADHASADDVRARLLPFAHAVNATLDACGFPLCRGDIMARNPRWCLSAGEWRERFGDWVRNPTPDALLNANIFFDFRPLWGDMALAQSLRDWLTVLTRDDQRFLRTMAQNALIAEPPLGFFGDFVTSGEGAQRGTLDLKTQGTRVFIDAARIFALSAGIGVPSTAARLRAAGAAMHVAIEDSEAVVGAFHFMLMLRLRHQHLEGGVGARGNRIDPRELNELDQRILKETFRQARKVQRRLAADYQL